MMLPRRLAAIGAILQGVFFLLVLFLIFGILPAFGLRDPSDFSSPAKVLPFVAGQPAVAFWLFAGDIPVAVFLFMTVMGLYDTWPTIDQPLLRMATAAGLISSTLILAAGVIGNSVMQLAQLSPQASSARDTVFVTLSYVSSNGFGLASGGIFAYGWWALLISWLALRAGVLMRVLHYLGMLFGVAGILAIFVPPLGILGLLIGIPWCLWLGISLLRA